MRRVLRVAAALALVGPATHAPRAAAAEPEMPWKAGISEADQARANALFDEANKLFAEQAHAVALDRYRAAVAIWDHPVIRFNMAITLVRLDRMLEAADALDSALRFGKTPFSEESYAQVLDYRKLVQGRVGEIEASCTQDGAQIVLDGKPWFACPGTKKMRVLVGDHTVTAEHPAMIAQPRRIAVSGGATSNVHVNVRSYEDSFTYERRYATWVPWAVTGIGIATFGAGVLLELNAQGRMGDYDRAIAERCAATGCDLTDPAPGSVEESLVELRDSAETRHTVALATVVVGAGVVIAGVVLIVRNQPVRRPIVNANVGADGASASVGWTF
jgi:hypothetical protein